jgi:hypothetical protein
LQGINALEPNCEVACGIFSFRFTYVRTFLYNMVSLSMIGLETMMNKFFLSAFLLLLTFNCIAQKDAGIKTLLSKSGAMPLPIPVKKINEALKVKPIVTNDEMFGDDYTWNPVSGLSFSGFMGEG